MVSLAGYLEISLSALITCFCGVTLGSAVQRLAGQGFGLISAPIVALVAPQMLPAALLLLGFASGLGSSALDLKHVNPKELPWGFSGRALGAVLAASLAASLPGFEEIAVLVAIIVLLAVCLSLSGLSLPIRRGTLFGAGLLAGLMGTLTAIGAPPMAMLYQREEAMRSRAMQSTFFFFGMIVSIAALVWKGLVTFDHLKFAAVLLPAIILGLLISQPIARYFSRDMVRPVALAFSTLAAIILLIKALLL